MINKVILSGNLTRDVDVKNYGETVIATTGLAVKDTFSKDDRTDFFDIVAFGKRAETMGLYLRKGDPVIIVGRIKIENYTDKDGNKKYATKIIVEQMQFLKKKDKSADEPTAKAEETATAEVPDADYSMIKDEDVPF